jgi:hypothetical protein
MIFSLITTIINELDIIKDIESDLSDAFGNNVSRQHH